MPVPGLDAAGDGECGGDAREGLALGVLGDSSCGRAELLLRGKIRGMFLNVPGRDGVGVFTLGGVDASVAVGVVGVSSTGESGREILRFAGGGGT